MMRMFAMIVVGQGLDNATLGHTSMAASVHHPLQLDAKRREPTYAAVNFAQVVAGDAVGLRAWLVGLCAHCQQFPDGLDLESQLARMTNEDETRYLGFAIPALLASAAGRRGHQGDRFIIANGGHLYARAAG